MDLRFLSLLPCLILAANASIAAAAITCEQLAEVAYAAEQLRNQGEPLAAVMAEANRLENTGKFSPHELQVIRTVVDRSFKGTQSPIEVLQACKSEMKR